MLHYGQNRKQSLMSDMQEQTARYGIRFIHAHVQAGAQFGDLVKKCDDWVRERLVQEDLTFADGTTKSRTHVPEQIHVMIVSALNEVVVKRPTVLSADTHDPDSYDILYYIDPVTGKWTFFPEYLQQLCGGVRSISAACSNFAIVLGGSSDAWKIAP